MDEDNLPEATGPVSDGPRSFEDSVGEIAGLIEDPDVDLSGDDQDTEADDQGEDVEDEGETPDPEDEDAEDDESEDVEGEEDAEGEDGSDETEYAGGRFAADNAKVKLDDGTTITIAELKRNNFFQRDYTKKTTELAKERDEFLSQKSEWDGFAQQLAEARDWLAWYGETYGPKKPQFSGDPNTDPVGYMDYLHKLNAYNEHAQAYQRFEQEKQADQQKRKSETQAQFEKRLQAEVEQLKQSFPDSTKPEFWQRLAGDAEQFYGLTKEEITSVADHRQIKILNDALAYRRLKAKAPEAKKQVEQKPKLPKTQQRANPKARQSREQQQKAERLRKSGDFNAGVEALMSFDL
ncbi:hypothetical protein [Pelagibacterium luteolum]|uniref:Uncharacterized protein n=1 Tax=Pelagibacterium luteolum TaxID=440168 RepID=A0A1G7TI47_9HYPH|nr:hypothetical protein [Pelagibacterium luteolum]SDG34704.1 hypothetical protein SAMN04487974_102130 [Pelagibacterium luteolum]